MKKQFLSFVAISAMALSLASCGNNAEKTEETAMDTVATAPMAEEPKQEEGVMVGGAMMVPSKNIVENAAGSSEHTTLVSAVQQAGLAETLSGAGPFTVFAPTNAAFDKLPKTAVEGLMKPENKGKLTNVLTYHVVPGKMMAADLTDGQKLKTVEGEELTVSVKDGKVMVNGAEVTTADVVSSNGVTHVIADVLMPKKK